jgi:hypothetical protein
MQAPPPESNTLNTAALQEKASDAAASVKEGASSAYNSLANSATQAKEYFRNSLGQFSSKSAIDAGQSFLNSNSVIAKFVFIILVLIVFLFLVRVGIFLVGFFTQPPASPYIIYGTNPGNNAIYVNSDPSDPNSPNIQRSNNQATGLEFTWSVWLLYNGSSGSSSNQYAHVFNKGSNDYSIDGTGVASTSNGPGLYFTQTTQVNPNVTPGLHIVMDDVTSAQNTVDVSGIPVGKWFHVALRMENRVMDVYVNGMIAARYVYDNVPRQNYYGTYVCQNGGFSGTLSNLRYYDHALDVTQINNILLSGPNLTASAVSQKMASTNYSYYLSSLWYNNKLTV